MMGPAAMKGPTPGMLQDDTEPRGTHRTDATGHATFAMPFGRLAAQRHLASSDSDETGFVPVLSSVSSSSFQMRDCDRSISPILLARRHLLSARRWNISREAF